MKHSLRNIGIMAMSAMLFAFSSPAKATPVDLELQLLVDVSGSVSASEFALQRDGYVNAFKSNAIQTAILDTTGGRLGKIAAQFIYWSGSTQQQIAVDWTEIGTAAQADAFADAISAFDRPFSGQTGPAAALNFGLSEFTNNGFDGATLVMDVSGDGADNEGGNTLAARNAALAGGITRINGLPIGGSASVENFYANNIVGGTNGFLIAASTFGDFQSAVARKLEFEIRGETPVIPLPASLPLIIAGIGALGGLGAMRRRREKSAA